MDLLETEYFNYRDGNLYCEDVAISEIVKNTGTPVYIYSKNFFIDRYHKFAELLSELNPIIFYAVKCNFNLSVINTFAQLGAGADVNSEGEYYRALKAGISPQKMILTGVGKTEREIKLGIENDLLMIKAESEQEIILINETASKLNRIAKVAIRVNPDVDAGTHPYISTGLMENKFGMNSADAYELLFKYQKFPNIHFTGLDIHIGSQINKTEPHIEAAEKISELWLRLKEKGLHLKHFDLGGGYGIKYKDEDSFDLHELAKGLKPLINEMGCQLLLEPGRYLTGNGGILAAAVQFIKNSNDKTFIITDAGMNDLLRPSIYNAYHHIQPVSISQNNQDIVADIVGPVCESGDFFAKGRVVSETHQGDYLAILSTGAYCMVMSSNYNARRRPPEVMVDKDQFKIIRSRESFDHMLMDEENLLYFS